ncbi:hypothetical protein DFH09DRAFT_1094695 [Mycena vulgaris]|nr:hypothetical protein DFH09DRAFT_1094695 [Mycena vulgaris]
MCCLEVSDLHIPRASPLFTAVQGPADDSPDTLDIPRAPCEEESSGGGSGSGSEIAVTPTACDVGTRRHVQHQTTITRWRRFMRSLSLWYFTQTKLTGKRKHGGARCLQGSLSLCRKSLPAWVP